MIEVSVIEITLFAWGVLATGMALKWRAEHHHAKHLLQVFIEEPEARKQILDSYQQWKESN